MLLVQPAAAQQPVRTRDASIATIKYDNGLYANALTLNEALRLDRPRSSLMADGLLSLFADRRWSMEGLLSGSRYTPPVNTPKEIHSLFATMRGEVELEGGSTAQQGLMPTVEVTGQARAHFTGFGRGLWFGGGIARSFDGDFWHWTLLSEVGGWLRAGSTVTTATIQPKRTGYGDRYFDAEVETDWTPGLVQLSGTVGTRVGELFHSNVRWAQATASYPITDRIAISLNAGSYPADLLQGLPGGRYASLAFRLPTRGTTSTPGVRRRNPVVPRRAPNPSSGAPTPPADSALAAAASATPVATAAPEDRAVVLSMTSARGGDGDMRVLRVHAPGAHKVELMGNFTLWEPVVLEQVAPGEWQATLRIPPGPHRLNVRIDGGEWDVPSNVPRVTDGFSGVVGTIIVR